MNVVDEVQLVDSVGGAISSPIEPSGACGLPISREKLLVLSGLERSITSEGRDSSSVNMFPLIGQTSETRNSD